MDLYRTTVVVTVFAFLEHALGFLYRIILSRVLGPEGLGIYQAALSVFGVFLTVCASGLPITLSRVISKHRARGNPAGERAATASAVLISLLFSVPVTLLLFLLRTPFSEIFSDPRCADLFYIFLFGLSLTSVYAVIRGSFWGNKRFFAYSLIELIEEIVMICVGVLLLVFLHAGVSDVNKAGIAVLSSYVCSFLIAVFYFRARGGKLRSPKGEFLPLLKSSLPVTVMRTSSSLMGSLVSVIFPKRLMATGMSSARAMSEYGVIGGMVMPVLMIPSSLIGSIALVIVPELSECYYRGDAEKLRALIARALKAGLLIAGILIPFFVACGEDAGVLLYSNHESGLYIRTFSFILLPMSVTMISTSILNSLGCEKQTLLFFLAGSAGMLLCVWVLPPYLGSASLLVGMACDYLFSAVCSLLLLKKKAGKLRLTKYVLLLLSVTVLSSIVGVSLRALFTRVFGVFFALFFTALGVGLFELLLLKLLRLFDPLAFAKKFFPKKKRA